MTLCFWSSYGSHLNPSFYQKQSIANMHSDEGQKGKNLLIEILLDSRGMVFDETGELGTIVNV